MNGETKSYMIECSSCGINETMVFQKRRGEFFFYHLPGTTIDQDGEYESVFEARKGILGDKPPSHCPECGKKLTVTEAYIRA